MSTKAPSNPFAALTWDDVEAWASSTIVSRGKSYQRSNRVQKLARTAGGGILAWVQGTSRYATRVEMAKKRLTASCTCPYAYGDTCKHAVAVVLSYLEGLKNQKEIPTAAEDDPRFDLLQEAAEAAASGRVWELEEGDDGDDEDEEDYDDEDDGDDDEEEDEDEDEEEEGDEPTGSYRAAKRLQPPMADGVTTYLEQQSKEDLIALLKELTRQHPDVRQTLVDRANLLSGEVKKLVATARKEINGLARMPAWGEEEDWGYSSGGGNYTRIRTHLEALLAAGHADEVLSLGQALLKAGTQQVEMINDEGETAAEVTTCMNIIFRALPRSSLAPAEQMLWAINAELGDSYDLCEGTAEFWQQSYAAADWNIVADQLATRLQKFASENRREEYSTTYRRDHLSNSLIRALEQAGRKDEIIPLCEREAEKTESYVRLVRYLKEAKRWQEMEQWIQQGIAATRTSSPGIASQLRLALRERREQEKNWPQVAAFYAEDFFDHPGAATLRDLQKAAKRAGVEAEVRASAFHYMETGIMPQTMKATKKTGGVPVWPLPECEVKGTDERRETTAPMIHALIDIAIEEKRPDEVLRWYDHQAPSKSPAWGYGWRDDDRIATAVVDTYPDRAIAMWKKLAESHLVHAEVRAYETAAIYLRKVHSAYKKQGQEQEWKDYVATLRQANLRRPRLVQILDSLTGKPIVEM